MALFTLRAAGEVRAPQFGSAEGDLDTEMVAIAGAIIRQRTGNFDPSTVPGQLLRRHRPRRVPERIQRRPRQVAPQGAVRRTRNLLADTLNIEAQTGMGRTGTMFHTIQRSSDRKSGSSHQRGQGQ
jgi:non-homologous end joining protein Ku